MIAKIKFKNKILEVNDVEKISGIKKYTGLMFKKENTNALLFDFGSPTKKGIHSLFCPNFVAIWLNEGKIVDYEVVNSARMLISPRAEFTKLLEIPINEKYSNIVDIFVNEGKSLNTPST